jgi:meso-butanediol dehydrogenase/(S,S)-butanediol dehydrogenase/diacetyl reductase
VQTRPVPDRFADQSAIVTGAAGGIGRATALRLGSEGARVLCLDVQQDAVEATAADIVAAGGTALARTCDVSRSAECTSAVTGAVDAWGGLDILANVAGILQASHTHETDDETWRRILSVNLDGPFYLSRAALPHLLETRGAIVNVASTAGIMGQAYLTAYSASKHGVVGLTKSMAIEYARKGLRVNAVCPGGVDTSMTQTIDFPEDVNFHLIMRAALVDVSQSPDSVANMIAWLASSEATYVNGAVVSIDAGVTAG